MMEKLNRLFEKYHFDYIHINPDDMDNVDFEYVPDEILADVVLPKNYLGRVKLGESIIKVFYDKKITPGDVILRYRDIKTERKFKIKSLYS